MVEKRLRGGKDESRLFCGILEPGDKVVPVLLLLQARKRHLGAGNVLLGVLEVLELKTELVTSKFEGCCNEQ